MARLTRETGMLAGLQLRRVHKDAFPGLRLHLFFAVTSQAGSILTFLPRHG
jgi:hypothetical protein